MPEHVPGARSRRQFLWDSFCGFGALAVTLLLAIKASADIKPADLGADGNTAATLAYIQAYPVWGAGVMAVAAVLLTVGAVQLARRRPLALPFLAAGVGLATLLTLIDLRLPDPGADRPMASVASLLIPLLCLVPVWWLSRRAPDLQAPK